MVSCNLVTVNCGIGWLSIDFEEKAGEFSKFLCLVTVSISELIWPKTKVRQPYLLAMDIL